jgi:hypothetical protein
MVMTHEVTNTQVYSIGAVTAVLATGLFYGMVPLSAHTFTNASKRSLLIAGTGLFLGFACGVYLSLPTNSFLQAHLTDSPLVDESTKEFLAGVTRFSLIGNSAQIGLNIGTIAERGCGYTKYLLSSWCCKFGKNKKYDDEVLNNSTDEEMAYLQEKPVKNKSKGFSPAGVT